MLEVGFGPTHARTEGQRYSPLSRSRAGRKNCKKDYDGSEQFNGKSSPLYLWNGRRAGPKLDVGCVSEDGVQIGMDFGWEDKVKGKGQSWTLIGARGERSWTGQDMRILRTSWANQPKKVRPMRSRGMRNHGMTYPPER
ncbi:hypothetical protein JTE90_028180 [Oedothorax gibbosus]|uniref:Uncharacterized protein n=1 Tax=Oedothorax gibbosus TaxID=931172 RepID=A0AAV6UE31_9ARAC|nr:hypothetical protein JTE90_028180 [Oedothorax gibbosus]